MAQPTTPDVDQDRERPTSYSRDTRLIGLLRAPNSEAANKPAKLGALGRVEAFTDLTEKAPLGIGVFRVQIVEGWEKLVERGEIGVGARLRCQKKEMAQPPANGVVCGDEAIDRASCVGKQSDDERKQAFFLPREVGEELVAQLFDHIDELLARKGLLVRNVLVFAQRTNKAQAPDAIVFESLDGVGQHRKQLCIGNGFMARGYSAL